MAAVTRVTVGIHMVHDQGEPTHVIAVLRGKQRTFKINGSLQKTVDRATKWRDLALTDGVDAADASVADDVVVRAKQIVRNESQLDNARSDVQRVLDRYPTPWNYMGYTNVYGEHITPSWRLVP